ncbi:MAG: hypothetical protein IPI58_01065 [Alphaproteobacteria bacterium]|nr:MAG: hypothetical protein IPI58_01065 [Alphaproteobacteria bacterium]
MPKMGVPMRLTVLSFVLALGCLALVGCGFRPVYGGLGGPVSGGERLNEVWIGTIPDRNGQMLRNMLTDRIHAEGVPSKPRYRLDVTLTSGEGDLGLRKDATATGRQLTIHASCVLTDAIEGRQVARWADRSVVRHNILMAPYATQVSRDDAWQRGLTDLSDSIIRSLTVYLQPAPKAGQKAPTQP